MLGTLSQVTHIKGNTAQSLCAVLPLCFYIYFVMLLIFLHTEGAYPVCCLNCLEK